MTDPESVEMRMRDHVFSREPSVQQSLLEKGEFPTNWVDNYLKLLKEAEKTWHNQNCLPRELTAAVHFASWYLHLRYKVWCDFKNSRNPGTEEQLGRIRTPSETFLLMSVINELPKPPDQQGS